MWEHNDGCGESNILQNQFTAYLVTAIRRKKFRYQQKKNNRQYGEVSLEQHDYLPALQTESDLLDSLSLIARLENSYLSRALEQQSERDMYIFLAKVLDGRSFVAIAAELDMEYQAVTAAYYRLIARLRKELRGGGK